MDSHPFIQLGISEPLIRALAASGYTTPTPIQTRAIPALLDGQDLLGIAQTGTGKTAAFTLPILQHLADVHEPPTPRGCRALVLAPTRELAIQIFDNVQRYSRFLKLRHACIYGGVGEDAQIKSMAQGVDMLIATPGRLLDLLRRRFVRLDQAMFLVLDEADRMLDMGFIKDVTAIVRTLPKERQSMLFSATMPKEIAELSGRMLVDPVRIEVSPKPVPTERIVERVYHVPAASKRNLLSDILRDSAMSRVIVFTRTKHGANRVTENLGKAGVAAAAIHGNKSQNARQKALADFKSGKARVLVATDIAARGIDVADVTHVVNFELPNIPESYVHRIGRTARAGAEGIAISFCDPSERSYLRDIERLTKRPLIQISWTAPANAGTQAQAPRPNGQRQDQRQDHRNDQRRHSRHDSRHDSGQGHRHNAADQRDRGGPQRQAA
ncbi:MAG: DEAD/DEAH box helicase [Rhodospirillaceae bacterium]|nr:DEAD/DEAH box helicase [Rhodospirillaceae bacterium]